VIDYFEKLSLFSAGIDRLSSFIHRVSVRGWGWHREGRGRGTGVWTGGKDRGVESPQHQSYLLSLYHVMGRVVRYSLSRMGVTVKTFDFRGAKVRPSHPHALTRAFIVYLNVTLMIDNTLTCCLVLYLSASIDDIYL
jgi:hypothetical protein